MKTRDHHQFKNIKEYVTLSLTQREFLGVNIVLTISPHNDIVCSVFCQVFEVSFSLRLKKMKNYVFHRVFFSD